jgi:signal transduction histidine kinase
MAHSLEDLRSFVRRHLTRSLSGRLLVLTIAFVMLAEVLIYFPSAARFYHDALASRLAAAQIAVLALEASHDPDLSPMLKRELLANAGVRAVALKRNNTRSLYLAEPMPIEIAVAVDLREAAPAELLFRAIESMIAGGERVMRVVGTPRHGGGEFIEILIDEAPVRTELFAFSWRIFALSLVIALVTSALVFMTLFINFVRPMQRLTQSMVRFQEQPADAERIIEPSARRDEIGQSERVLAAMQTELRQALQQREHLAALGTAVAKIQHDLRNILASAQLASDRLSTSKDPAVQRMAPRLVQSIDRAIALATNSLRYGRAEETPPRRQRVALLPLAEEAMNAALAAGEGEALWRNDIAPDLTIDADPEQLLRVIVNIGRNAVEAVEGRDGGRVVLSAMRDQRGVVIELADNGAGIPDEAAKSLFQPFAARGRAGGTGLGLAIARELARGHGGDVTLARTGPEGTVFRIWIPDAQHVSKAAQ